MKVAVSVSGPTGGHARSVQCHAELEVEQLDQHHVDRLIELTRQCDAVVGRTTGSASSPNNTTLAANGNDGPRPATEKQVKAIHAIAGRQGVELAGLLQSRFGIGAVSALSIKDASALIDELKSNQARA